MNAKREPMRLSASDDGSVPVQLRAALRDARVQYDDAAALTALAALRARLAAELAGAAPRIASGPAVSTSFLWLVAACLVIAGWQWSQHATRSVSDPKLPASVERVPSQLSKALPAPVTAPAIDEDKQLAMPPPTARVRAAVAAPRRRTVEKQQLAPRANPTPAPAPAPAPEAELALLRASHEALDREPSRALALAEEHAASYPNGIFAEERELLALEALLKLRHTDAALVRARAFMQRFPHSAHARRVRTLLDRPSAASAPTSDDSAGTH